MLLRMCQHQRGNLSPDGSHHGDLVEAFRGPKKQRDALTVEEKRVKLAG